MPRWACQQPIARRLSPEERRRAEAEQDETRQSVHPAERAEVQTHAERSDDPAQKQPPERGPHEHAADEHRRLPPAPRAGDAEAREDGDEREDGGRVRERQTEGRRERPQETGATRPSWPIGRPRPEGLDSEVAEKK